MRKTAGGKIKNTEWMEERKIPIRVLKGSGNYGNFPMKNGFDASVIFKFAFSALKKSLVFSLMVLATASQSALFSAFEAHVINVTATIEDGIAEYIVINEVYYDVGHRKFCAVDEEKEPRNEWIELYNPTDEPVDVSGWIIEDNNSSDVIPASPFIPAHGFAVISKNDSTWLFWNIPPEAVKIALGSVIGNGLSNDGDRVILKDASGAEIDAVSYGDDTYAFVPSVPSVSEGHSIARSPKGFDTNKSSDWVELEVPNPGINPHYKEHTDGTPCSGSGAGSEANASETDNSETDKGSGDSEQIITGDNGDNENDSGIENENSGENPVDSANEDLNKEQEKPENGEESEIEENQEESSNPDDINETALNETTPDEIIPDEIAPDETIPDETVSNETEDNISEESSASEELSEEPAEEEIIVKNDDELVSFGELESDGGE